MGLSHTNVLIIAVCFSAGFLLLLLFVILVTTVLLLGVRRKQKRGTHYNNHSLLIISYVELWYIYTFPGVTVTDHIAVDDNPVYITVKKIDMNKNSAYEVVHLGTNMH